MEIKGDLKPGGLPTLFRNFATENFTGVLTLTSSVGEKLITLTENEVTIFTDELCEASRLGNILLARGIVTEENLQQALKDQQKLEPRPKLGDLLISRGIVTGQACADARRFQIEEDICDVLSWKNARFVFARGDSAREIHIDDFAPEQVHRVSIDPDSFFKSVTRLCENWESVGDRLPTQYLCFKLSLKAESQMALLPREAQLVLRYLKEGRTVEGAVKQSCLGRIEVCSQVIQLLEKGLILPASGAELRFRASEHRAHKRYHDALYIYRRLIESPEAKDEQQYLENLMAETALQIVSNKQQGDYGEEAIVVSHKEAKERFLREQARKRVLALTAAGLMLVAGGLWWLHSAAPKAGVPEDYKAAIVQAEEATRRGDFVAVMRTWNGLKEKVDPDSELARKIQDYVSRVPGQIDVYIESQLIPLEEQLLHGGDERKRARERLGRLKEDYPRNASEPKIDTLLAKYKDLDSSDTPKAASNGEGAAPSFSTRNELVKRMKKSDELFQQKKFKEASREYFAITREAPVNDEIWKQADGALKNIQEIEGRLNEELKKAEAALLASDGDKAVELGEKLVSDYGDLDSSAKAQALVMRLKFRKSTGVQLLKSAREEEESGRIFEALRHYKQVAEGYLEFPVVCADATAKAKVLSAKVDDLRKRLEEALEAVKTGDFRAARRIYAPLLDKNSQLLVDQRVDLPVHITSEPPGSIAKLNGELQGKTPLNVLIRAGEQYELEISRPGFKPRRYARERIGPDDLEVAVRLQVEPLVYDFPNPFFVPPINLGGHMVLINGPEIAAYDPPSREPVWRIRNLFNDRASLPDGAEDKYFWHCRQQPVAYKPGRLLLPMRNRELDELDIRSAEKPSRSTLLAGLPAEIAGTIFQEEHSMLAGKSLLMIPFADGSVRCYEEFEKLSRDQHPAERWNVALDPQDATRREPPAAGLYHRQGHVWALSGGGRLNEIDPIDGKVTYSNQFQNMSPRSAFSDVPNDNLAALIQRNGRVIIMDLQQRAAVWELPPRQAMEESVGVMIDDSGVYVASRKDDGGELRKYKRMPEPGMTIPTVLWSAKLDGHCELEMSRGKHLYLITHFNKVFAYSLAEGRQLWDFKVESELGEAQGVRAVGEHVVVVTSKGKAIVLKAD